MPDLPTPPPEQPKPKPPASDEEAAAVQVDADDSGITPGMSEQQIRDAGLMVEVPYESGEPKPKRLQYRDLGKTYDGPPEDWSPSGVTARAPEDEVEGEAASGVEGEAGKPPPAPTPPLTP